MILPLSTSYTDPIPQAAHPKIYKFNFVIISRFLDHVTILFTLLWTWEIFVIEVIINIINAS